MGKLNDNIKKLRKALQFNYGVKTTIQTFQYLSTETGQFCNKYLVRVNGKEVIRTNSQVAVLMTLKETYDKVQELNIIDSEGKEL